MIFQGAMLILVACGRDPLGPVPERLLSEAWEWQSACCGVAGDARTPATEGYSYVLRFREDGTVRAERDGTLLLETTFRLRRVSPIDFADEFTRVNFGEPLPLGPGIEPVSQHMLSISENSLLSLSSMEGCADCYGDWKFLPRLELRGGDFSKRAYLERPDNAPARFSARSIHASEKNRMRVDETT